MEVVGRVSVVHSALGIFIKTREGGNTRQTAQEPAEAERGEEEGGAGERERERGREGGGSEWKRAGQARMGPTLVRERRRERESEREIRERERDTHRQVCFQSVYSSSSIATCSRHQLCSFGQPFPLQSNVCRGKM